MKYIGYFIASVGLLGVAMVWPVMFLVYLIAIGLKIADYFSE